jgi:hypothetical protein
MKDKSVTMLEDHWKFVITLLRQCKELQTATIGQETEDYIDRIDMIADHIERQVWPIII